MAKGHNGPQSPMTFPISKVIKTRGKRKKKVSTQEKEEKRGKKRGGGVSIWKISQLVKNELLRRQKAWGF